MDPIQSFLDSHASVAADSIPQQPLACCCGNDQCAYLRQNASALESLEREVRKAAQIGQALLLRHEAYIADSEREREDMTAHIEHLEEEKVTLEKKNATVIAENRDLLDRLEEVNNAVADSDAHVTSLQATLQSTQLELQKLANLAARTERLEQELLRYEQEQAECDASLEAKEQSEKSAVRRWQQAERDLADMNEQIERIEREAREEKERHLEVVGRMERRHAVEKELTTAAGRLKGAAAAKTNGRDPGGTSVVSHFVKDILQDNANLQMGIVELREMLQNSNDEVEIMSRQMEDHQPATAEEPELATAKTTAKKKDLRDELQRASSQELHVHHHYHAPAPSAGKTPTVRRAKKKRYGVLTPGHFTPPSGYSTPRSSISYGTPSSAATILQQTAVSIPQPIPHKKRFSTASNATYNSLLSTSGPASPQSTTNRTSSIFDRVFSDGGHESSRPTTPGSEDLGSPLMAPVDSKRKPSLPWRTSSAPVVHRRGISPGAGRMSIDSTLSSSLDDAFLEQIPSHDAIPEESEGEWENESSATTNTTTDDHSLVSSPLSDELLSPMHNDTSFYRPALRRAASHESLLSVSGMDIHTLKTRPSQLLAAGHAGRALAPRAELSNAHAQGARTTATLSRPAGTSGRDLLSGMAGERRAVSGKTSASGGFGSKVGGWVFGRWGATPAPTFATDTASATSSAAKSNSKPGSRSSAEAVPAFDPEATPKKVKVNLRPPGINQPGPIFGFGPEVKVQRPPVMGKLDEEALRRALEY